MQRSRLLEALSIPLFLAGLVLLVHWVGQVGSDANVASYGADGRGTPWVERDRF